MTDEEWKACENPSRMRGMMRIWPDSHLRWARFDLACIDRVLDLIDDQGCLESVRVVSNWAWGDKPPPQWYRLEQQVAIDAIRKLWQCKTDPLKHARIAATRAVASLASHTLYPSEMVCVAAGRRAGQPGLVEAVQAEKRIHASLVRCVFCSTLLPVHLSSDWRTDTAVAIARGMYESRDFSAMPILADALQDGGCDSDDILTHCRDANATHVRGCWVVDLVLGK